MKKRGKMYLTMSSIILITECWKTLYFDIFKLELMEFKKDFII